MGKRFKQIYDGDIMKVTGKVACCDCGLVHYFKALRHKKGKPTRMLTYRLARSTATLRRHHRARLRRTLRKAGLSR